MHVVATAGHVDHGKSTLVRALTGTDPDRLDVADNTLGGARLADVDDRRTGLHVVSRDHVGLAGRGDDDVGLTCAG